MRAVSTFLLFIAAASFAFAADHDSRPDVSKNVFNWENLEVLSVNREVPHAQVFPFPSRSAALELDRSDSPWVLSLDGPTPSTLSPIRSTDTVSGCDPLAPGMTSISSPARCQENEDERNRETVR